MKVGIMQPYFFPYLGYISLIKHTDRFVLLDCVQFIKHGWIDRNRILKPGSGWQYIRIPLVKYRRTDLIENILINNSLDWKRKILAQLEHYKKKAPYYQQVIDLLRILFDFDYTDIVTFNKASLAAVCGYLGIQREIVIFSGMNLEIDPVNAPDEWSLNICKAIGDVTEYWNPIGGHSFYNRSKFKENGIGLRFHSPFLSEYDQKRDDFEPGLSIIDLMMFNSPEEINGMLDKYELL